jgi:hypothetical protein
MDRKNGPLAAGEDRRRGRQRCDLNITPLEGNVKPPRIADSEYRRLSSLPFSKMTREESLTVCAEVRRRLAGIRFRFDLREFQGRHYWERGFLSCVIAGGKIPGEIAGDCFKIPRNRLIFEALRELERLGMAGPKALAVLLRETGQLEAAGGEDYVRDIESMIGVPSAIRGFALGILRLHLGARV